ncbi:MAG: hypothetical protein NC094_04575 [Bacteroidales bacterium]|nr:hypothetical protein [Lachnoclostridium sp.]MCM1383965.1 hypothetical protein [Lachnoclostridium sp.]MCM1464674.1 hypothetical protein [Bacteroidales bacterium]
MKIDSSTIGMESARSYRTFMATSRRFTITDYRGGLAQNQNALNTAVKDSKGQAKNGNENSKQTVEEGSGVTLTEAWQNRFGISTGRINLKNSRQNTVSDLKQISLRYIFDMLFSRRRGRMGSGIQDDIWNGQNLWSQENTWSSAANNVSTVNNSANVNAADAGTNIDALFATNLRVLNYTQETFSVEAENTAFSTVGTVRTSDGREINFNVNVGMSREFQEYYRDDLEMAQFSLCDPLVINMDTDVAELSDQTFYFDIDADGVLDEISGLGSGSGYLALDKNGDGVINDGSELFGTASGNGFADLAKYDEDGNGWIDENDEIWSKLKIWTKDENGKDVLYRLADKGVGAICLQNASTDFTLKGDSGQTQGVIRNTGVFLYENGNVGTIQHVDVAKYDREA